MQNLFDYSDPLKGLEFKKADFKCKKSDDVYQSNVLVEVDHSNDPIYDYDILQVKSILESGNTDLFKVKFRAPKPTLNAIDKMSDAFVAEMSDIDSRLAFHKQFDYLSNPIQSTELTEPTEPTEPTESTELAK